MPVLGISDLRNKAMEISELCIARTAGFYNPQWEGRSGGMSQTHYERLQN